MQSEIIAFKNFKFLKSKLNLICFALFLIVVSSCTPKQESFKIIEFSGADGIFNYSKTVISFMGDNTNPALLLASKGDLFWMISDDNVFFIPDRDDIQKPYKVFYDDDVLFVNDKIRSICITDTLQLVPWFETLIKKDLSQLQFICMESVIPEICNPYLEKIVKIRPDVGIYSDGSLSEMTGFKNNFNPRYLMISDITNEDINLLNGFTNLEMLYLEDPELNESLPNLPKLKQVFVSLNMANSKHIPEYIFANNPHIEKLVLHISNEFEISSILSLENLKELILDGSDLDFISDFDGINHLEKLEVLSIFGNNRIYDPEKIDLPALRWMSFDTNITQQEFNTFIETHPKLEVVEIVDNKNITDLRLLSNLNNLYGLTITDTITDLVSVQALKRLKYLSLPADFLDEGTSRENLQEALPEARITSNDGYLCLGSGWLLLLLPLVIIFSLFLHRKTIISVKQVSK